MCLETLIDKASTVLGARRLVRLPADRPVVFVGDTHGDRIATEQVLERFDVATHSMVFMGDVVDRGPDSLGNLKLLLSQLIAHPGAIHLLMGNHEAWRLAPFSPADFWDSLSPDASDQLGTLLLRLPLAAWHPVGVLAVHGALPDVRSLDDINGIELGSSAWRDTTWGDWHSPEEGSIPIPSRMRPSLDRSQFARRMAQIGARILVRSHQPSSPTLLFDDRCLTLFTSCAYGDGVRRVALLHPDRPIETARQLELIEL